MNKTTISWTDYSSNPIHAIGKKSHLRGWMCTKVSEGCKNCYAERINRGRFGNRLSYTVENIDNVEWKLSDKELNSWGRLKKPSRIFVCDMIDLFHEAIPDHHIFRVLSTMREATWHTFQVLTKRPERMREIVQRYYQDMAHISAVFDADVQRPHPNIWLGVSVENQKAAEERVPLLFRTPAAVRFLSCEPLLGPLDLGLSLGYVDWVIAGGESGPGFRPMDLDWARSLQRQCKLVGTAFWFKQESGPRPGSNPTLDGIEYHEFPVLPW